MSNRIAFRMSLNADQVQEYKARHDAIWPDLSAALKHAGVSDYTIWYDPETSHLFGTLLLSDGHSFDNLPNVEVVQRWWRFMSDIMPHDETGKPVTVVLEKMFDLP